MVEALFELLFEVFGEFFLQLVFELFGEAFKTGWRTMAQRLTGRYKTTTALRETLWAALTGCVAGAITLWLFPVLAIRLPWLQLLNVVLAPVAAGLLVERVRALRESRRPFSVPVFAYAALFGLMFALTRWLFGH